MGDLLREVRSAGPPRLALHLDLDGTSVAFCYGDVEANVAYEHNVHTVERVPVQHCTRRELRKALTLAVIICESTELEPLLPQPLVRTHADRHRPRTATHSRHGGRSVGRARRAAARSTTSAASESRIERSAAAAALSAARARTTTGMASGACPGTARTATPSKRRELHDHRRR